MHCFVQLRDGRIFLLFVLSRHIYYNSLSRAFLIIINVYTKFKKCCAMLVLIVMHYFQ